MIRLVKSALAAVMLVSAGSAAAWGPRTESAIVSSAASLLGKEAVLRIERVDANLRDGALMTTLEMERLYPDFNVNPVAAIENEMLLLQSLRSGQIDGYYAYRLGALGKLVANVTAPLSQADPAYANLYYKDVEERIGSTTLEMQRPQVVDPRVYFQRRVMEANVNADVIVREYKSGVGFRGVAGQTIQEAASRSVASVADVWRTILTEGRVEAGVSAGQIRDYVVQAYEYYIGRGDRGEILSADRRLQELTDHTPDMTVRIGDLFYAAGMRDDAIRRYERALADMPERRDVAARIADHYIALGEEALLAKKLEDAVKAFGAALAADPLHASAEARRLEAARLIEERDYRLTLARMALEEAAGFEVLADREVLNGRIAEAVALLHEARNAYSEIDDEFPLEYQKAVTGMRAAANKLESLRGDLMANSRLLSGTGFSIDAARMARQAGRGMDEATLKAMIRDAQTSLEQQLQADAEPLLRIQ